MYGHTLSLARAVEEGASSITGADVLLRRVEEFDAVIQATKDNAGVQASMEKQKDIPICTLDELRECDALILGSLREPGGVLFETRQR